MAGLDCGMLRTALFTLVLFASCSGLMTDSAPTTRPNLAIPTLGGKQLWADRRWQEGWRIQENVLTGHHRLLDDNDRRRAWGNLAACLLELEARAPKVVENDSTLVLLIHGMGRSRAAFSKMQEALQVQGFSVASISYPSTRRPVSAHAQQLAEILQNLNGYSKVCFVTHSLGGIVVRQLLADRGDWMQNLTVERIVMLAPPNQGSAFALKLESFAPFRWLFGDTGLSLTPDAMATMPVPEVPFLVIAGSSGKSDGYNSMLEGDDDFVVRVAETHLAGETAHLVVSSLHTFLMNQDAAITATADFLRDGTIPDHAR